MPEAVEICVGEPVKPYRLQIKEIDVNHGALERRRNELGMSTGDDECHSRTTLLFRNFAN